MRTTLYKVFLMTGGLLWLACHSYSQEITVHAHRGFRGLMTENSIPAMLNALHHGAKVLEMDISFSRDKYPLLSHDPWISTDTTTYEGDKESIQRKRIDLYTIDYDSISRYPIPTMAHKGFPRQKEVVAYIPMLNSLIDSVEIYVQENNLDKPWYSIETKSSLKRDHKQQPPPAEFVQRLMEVIVTKGIDHRVIIQSFDPRTLEIIHKDYPYIKTMLNTVSGTLEENLAKLTFVPDMYAPDPKLIDQKLIDNCQRIGLEIVGGNTNDKSEIDRIIRLGIKAYISDYPYELLP